MTTTNELQIIVLEKQKELTIAQTNLRVAQIEEQITAIQNETP